MSGTRAGGLKALTTNQAKYGLDFYRRIGQKGGASSHTGGFYGNRRAARIAGAKGGKKSRRGPTVIHRLENDRDNILRLREHGTTITELAWMYDVSWSTVDRWLRKVAEEGS